MKNRGNIAQVATIAESKARLIEGIVTKVYPQNRMALVRLDGSSQVVQINLGAIDPSLVSGPSSRVLLYNANGLLYAISAIPGAYAGSSPGNTLGDSWGGTKFSVRNAQSNEVVSIDSGGSVGYSGDLKPTRDGTEYTGQVVINKGHETGSSDVTLSTSAQDCISKTITVPGSATLRIWAASTLRCTALSATNTGYSEIYISSSRFVARFTFVTVWESSTLPLFYQYTPSSEESVTFKIRSWKSTSDNTIAWMKDQGCMDWDIIA